MPISILISIISSFIITYLTIPQIVHVTREKKIFDEPNPRKVNKEVIPTLGGIGIFLGFTISSMLMLQKQVLPEIRYIYAAVVIMFFLGLKDDMISVSAIKKLVTQMGVALILVTLGNFRINLLHELTGTFELPSWISSLASVLIFLFLINAFNLIDGIDGLASGLALTITSFLGIWFFMSGHLNFAILCCSFCGSLVAFLRFNLWGGKNKIFMGDTGSLIIGVFISAIVIKFINFNQTATGPLHFGQASLTALALLIVPVTDTLRVFIIRLYHGQSPFKPDMNHIHHLLLKSGMSHIQGTCFLIAYTIAFFLFTSSLQSYFSALFNILLIMTASFLSVYFLIKRNQRINKFTKAKMVVLKNQELKEKKQVQGIWLNSAVAFRRTSEKERI